MFFPRFPMVFPTDSGRSHARTRPRAPGAPGTVASVVSLRAAATELLAEGAPKKPYIPPLMGDSLWKTSIAIENGP